LTKDDFEVTENSILENTVHFSSETDVALNLGAAIDTQRQPEQSPSNGAGSREKIPAHRPRKP